MSDSDDSSFSDFICICDDAGQASAAALVDEVLKRLPQGKEEQESRPPSAESLVSDVVWSLKWDFDATVTDVLCDHWFGVLAKSNEGDFHTFVQCDRLEHGFAATWKAFADRIAGRSASSGDL